jgi:spore coat polysaccharide biosynthesis protein SpsF
MAFSERKSKGEVMNRKLVASLACRVNSTRLYGKPLHFLDVEKKWSVLEYIIDLLESLSAVDVVALAISSAPGNEPFQEIAEKRGIPWILGDEEDVLKRHLDAGKKVGATDAFIITPESPFLYFEKVTEIWDMHCTRGNDVTAIDHLPDGCGFSITTISAIGRSYVEGEERHRGETSLFIRENPHLFKVETIEPEENVRRPDIRLTIDFPEDLVLCRRVYEQFKGVAPRVPVAGIIHYLDVHPQLKELVAEHVIDPQLYQ